MASTVEPHALASSHRLCPARGARTMSEGRSGSGFPGRQLRTGNHFQVTAAEAIHGYLHGRTNRGRAAAGRPLQGTGDLTGGLTGAPIGQTDPGQGRRVGGPPLKLSGLVVIQHTTPDGRLNLHLLPFPADLRQIRGETVLSMSVPPSRGEAALCLFPSCCRSRRLFMGSLCNCGVTPQRRL